MPFSNDEVILEQRKSRLQSLILVFCGGLFFISLFNTSYCTTNGGCVDSWAALLMGWLGLFAGGVGFTWLANPLLIVSWILLYRNKRGAWIPALLATMISMSFLHFDATVTNEAGHY